MIHKMTITVCLAAALSAAASCAEDNRPRRQQVLGDSLHDTIVVNYTAHPGQEDLYPSCWRDYCRGVRPGTVRAANIYTTEQGIYALEALRDAALNLSKGSFIPAELKESPAALSGFKVHVAKVIGDSLTRTHFYLTERKTPERDACILQGCGGGGRYSTLEDLALYKFRDDWYETDRASRGTLTLEELAAVKEFDDIEDEYLQTMMKLADEKVKVTAYESSTACDVLRGMNLNIREQFSVETIEEFMSKESRGARIAFYKGETVRRASGLIDELTKCDRHDGTEGRQRVSQRIVQEISDVVIAYDSVPKIDQKIVKSLRGLAQKISNTKEEYVAPTSTIRRIKNWFTTKSIERTARRAKREMARLNKVESNTLWQKIIW
jgi:hypothetical protein